MEILEKGKSNLVKVGIVLLIILSLYCLAKTFTEIKGYRYIGGGVSNSNVISFDGTGEISASPDLAAINLTIRENAKTMKEAQDKVTTKETAVLDFLDKNGIEKKDIKAESYNSYPKYDYVTPCWGTYCRQETPKIIGYEVSEYISIKVRDLTKSGEIVQAIGSIGISEINGPDFSIEKEDQLKEQARKIAIDEAKAKAETLAKDLGVQLVRIVGFSENGNYPMQMYEKGLMASDSVGATASTSPALPTGESKITSTVTITYEIR
jgi:uncharacterized protein YggE